MKKHIIAAAVAAAVAAPAAFAGAPTVYGQLNMSVDSGKFEGVDEGFQVSSNNSRVGVKGSADLGNGLKAIYKMEFKVDADVTTNGGTITGRNTYAGLAGGFGAVLLGRHDTPMKMSQATDLFNDGYGDNKYMAAKLGIGGAGGEVRASNVLAYVSPSFGGVKLVGALVPYEDGKDSSLTDVYSVAVMYGSKKKGLFLSGAVNGWDKRGTVTGKSATEYRVSAQYTMGGLIGNIMYQNFDNTDTDGNNIQVNLGYTIGAATLKGKYSHVDYDKSVTTAKDGDGFGVGVDYAFGKKTTGYIEYVSMDKKTKIGEASIVSVGLLHKF